MGYALTYMMTMIENKVMAWRSVLVFSLDRLLLRLGVAR